MKLGAALVDLAGELNLAGVTFAVVGGLAASARGEARFTRDIDMVVAASTDEVAEALVFQLTQRGYLVLATVEQDATHRHVRRSELHRRGRELAVRADSLRRAVAAPNPVGHSQKGQAE